MTNHQTQVFHVCRSSRRKEAPTDPGPAAAAEFGASSRQLLREDRVAVKIENLAAKQFPYLGFGYSNLFRISTFDIRI
jgi:hypothetical protein